MHKVALNQLDEFAKRPLKALVVNDSLLERLSLGKMCALAGFQVLEATSEDNLIDYIEREKVDLLVCDSQLGEQDGLEVCISVRAAKLEFFIYFLLVSSNDTELFTIRALEAGADDHISKPLNRQEFTARMAGVHRSIERQKGYYSTRAALPTSLQHLYRDMRAMSNYQRSRLPKRRSVIQGLKVDYLWIPKVFVSGDLFNVFQLDEQFVAFYMLDVVGHGVPSALHVMDLAQLLSANPKEGILLEPLPGGYGHHIRKPSEVLGLMNKRFQMRPGNEVFFFMMYGLFNLHTGVVTVSMAGSPLPWVQDLDGNLLELGQPSFPIGVIEDDSYEDFSHKLDAGMRLFVCSDGLTQIRDAQDNELEMQGVSALIQEGVRKTVSQQIEAVQTGLTHWVSGKKTDRLYEDDATLFALQWRNKGDDDLFEEEPIYTDSSAPAIETVQQPVEPELGEPEFKFLRRKEASTVLLWRDAQASDALPAWLVEWGYFPEQKQRRDECVLAAKTTYFSFLVIDLQNLQDVNERFVNDLRQGLNPSIYVLLMANPSNASTLPLALQAGADSSTVFDYSPREIYTRLNTGLKFATIHRTYTEESESASALRTDIEKDLERIAAMQLENLPKPLEQTSLVQFDLFFKPAGLLSNHYMNVMVLPDGCIAYFHLTSQGEGLVGATRGLSIFGQLTSAASNRNSSLSQFMGEQFSPSIILRELNSQLLQGGEAPDETCALCYGILNPHTRVGRVAHAGYPMNIITRAKGDVEQLGAYGSALGVSVDSQYQDVVFTMNLGDRLFIIPPDLNVHPAFNGRVYENPVEFVRTSLELERSELILRLDELSDMLEPVPQDQSLLVFQLGDYVPLQVETLSVEQIQSFVARLSAVLSEPVDANAAVRIRIPNNIDLLPELIERMESTVGGWPLNEEGRGSFPLVLFELTSNVCRHGGLADDSSFELIALKLFKAVLFVMVDAGSEMPEWLLDSAREHNYEFDAEVEAEIPVGGLGLPLVNSLSSRFVYQRHQGVNYSCAWFDG